jgi:large subunit ribosomal protein L9
VKLNGKSFVILRQAGESGQLYGSVTTRDIADAASTAEIKVLRTHVLLEQPIKSIGIYKVRVALHPEVVNEVQVNVARTSDEAEAQARGEILTGTISEREEARLAAEQLFEAETLAKAELAPADEAEGSTEKKSGKSKK